MNIKSGLKYAARHWKQLAAAVGVYFLADWGMSQAYQLGVEDAAKAADRGVNKMIKADKNSTLTEAERTELLTEGVKEFFEETYGVKDE